MYEAICSELFNNMKESSSIIDWSYKIIGLKSLRLHFIQILDQKNNKVLYGEAPHWGPTPSPFINTRLLTEKVALFYTFQTAVNALSLKYEETAKQTVFLDFFADIKCICNPFRAFLLTEKTWFLYPFIWFRQ